MESPQDGDSFFTSLLQSLPVDTRSFTFCEIPFPKSVPLSSRLPREHNSPLSLVIFSPHFHLRHYLYLRTVCARSQEPILFFFSFSTKVTSIYVFLGFPPLPPSRPVGLMSRRLRPTPVVFCSPRAIARPRSHTGSEPWDVSRWVFTFR